MSEIDKCPPWKRKKVEPQGNHETKVVPIHPSEPEFEPWLPDKRNPVIASMDRDAKESLFFCRIVTGLLNKLTWENFEKLSGRMKNLLIDTPKKVQLVVDMIHRRAVVEWKYSILYVKMCDVLRRAQADKERKSVLPFSTCLISKCDEFFTRSLRQDDDLLERVREIDSCDDKDFKAAMTIEYQTQERIFRENLVAHCRFVGELFNMKIIHSGVIFDMLDKLLTATMFVSVECICTIISTIGLIYDECIGEFPDKYFAKMKSVLKSNDVPVWVRYHIHELLDLRNRHWRPKTLSRERIRESRIDKNRPPASTPTKRRIEESKSSETIPQKKRIQDSEKKHSQESRNSHSTSSRKERSHESKRSHDTSSRKERRKSPAAVSRTDSIRESEVKKSETIVPKKSVQESKTNQKTTLGRENTQESQIKQDELKSQSSFKDRVCKALDALTPHNIGLQVMTMTPFGDALELKYLADAIFDKASWEPGSCAVYARLCNVMLSFRVPADNESGYLEFRTVVLEKGQQLLDELGTQDSKGQQMQYLVEEDEDDMRRKATIICPFLTELSKLKIFTPEFNFQLCTKLIELRIEESLAMLRDLLTANGKAILLRLKKRGRYAELFNFFDKLQDIYKDEKYSRIPFESQVKADLRKFIYGIENEFFIIQEIVHEGPIPSMKEFNATTLFWYLRVFFNESRLNAKQAPKWITSQKSMFTSSKTLHEAISQLLKYTLAVNSYNAARSGHFFIYLMKWVLITPQDVINGLSIFFKTVPWQKRCSQLKIVARNLFESGYFNYNDLKKVLPADLVPKQSAKLALKPLMDLTTKPPAKPVPNAAGNLVPVPMTTETLVPVPKAPVNLNPVPKAPVNLNPVPKAPANSAPKPLVNSAPKPSVDSVPKPSVNSAPKPETNDAQTTPVANNVIKPASTQNQYTITLQPSFVDRVGKVLDALSRETLKNAIFSMSPIVNVAELEYIVNVVFLKMTITPKNCEIYAKFLSETLWFCVPNGDDENSCTQLKTVLLRKCQQFVDEMDPSEWRSHARSSTPEDQIDIFRKSMNYCRLMTELCKLKILTPTIMYPLILRIIELRIKFSIDWLSAIISSSGKQILVALREQNRMAEVFQLFEKLEPLLRDEKYETKINAKNTLKDFIYFEAGENVVQSLVMRGVELKLKTFTPITVFRYLKVYLYQCNHAAKKLPKYVVSQQRMFSFSRALTVAISLLLTYVIERKPSKFENCGSLLVWLIRWNLISPGHVVEGITHFLRTPTTPQTREKLESIAAILFNSGFFKLDDLRLALPQRILMDPALRNIEKPQPAVNNFAKSEKSISKMNLDQIQLQPSFEERVRKAIDTLTPSNIKNQIFLMIPLLNEPQFMYVADVVFQRVLSKPENHELYVKLCLDMWSFSVPNEDDETTQLEFSTVLLRKGYQLLNEFEINESERGYSRYSSEESETEIRQKVIICCRFIVELCGLKTVDSEIMIHVCAKIIEFGIEEKFFDWMVDPLRNDWNEIISKLRVRGLFDTIFKFFEKLENILKEEKYADLSRTMVRYIYGLENEFAMQEISSKGPPPSLNEFTPIMLFWYLRVLFHHRHIDEKEMPEWVTLKKDMFSSNKFLPEVIAKLISYALLKNACSAAEGGRFLNEIMKLELVTPQNVLDGLEHYFKNYNLGAKGRKRARFVISDLRKSGFFTDDDLKKIIPDDLMTGPNENEGKQIDLAEIQLVVNNLAEPITIPNASIIRMESLEKRITRALNTLTTGNIGAQANLMYPLFKVSQFEQIADAILEKVIVYPDRYALYVKFCEHLQFNRVPSENDEFGCIEFRTVLSHKCMKFFDYLLSRPMPPYPLESNNKTHLTSTGSWRFLMDFTKLKISTVKCSYYFCTKLLELRNPVISLWLRDLLRFYMKDIVSELKEQRRYEEIFQFFEKIKSVADGKEFISSSISREIRDSIKFSIYGFDKESIIQEIVYEGPIPPLKEFTAAVLFWYLRVFFHHCNLKAKILPEFVSSQKERIKSNKNLPEAVSLLLNHGSINDNSSTVRCGQFLIYLIKWDFVSPQEILDGISHYCNNVIVSKKAAKKKNLRGRQKILYDNLLESGHFKGDDLKKVMPPSLFETNVVQTPVTAEVPLNTKPLPIQQPPTNSPVNANPIVANTKPQVPPKSKGKKKKVSSIPQLMETQITSIPKLMTIHVAPQFMEIQAEPEFTEIPIVQILTPEMQKNNIRQIINTLVPEHFNSNIFVSQMSNCLTEPDHLEFAASLIIERMLTFVRRYKFYVEVCKSILKLAVEGKEFWMMLVIACDKYCNRLLFPSNKSSSKENSSEVKVINNSKEEKTPEKDSLVFIPMAVIITDSDGRSKAVFTDSATEANDRYTIDVPSEAFNQLNKVDANVAQSFCHSCGSTTETVDIQLKKIKQKETYYRSFMENFQKKVLIRPIPEQTESATSSADNNPRCTVYMPRGVHQAITNTIDFSAPPVCSACGNKNEVLEDQWELTKMRMESIDKVMKCVCARVNFKLNNVPVKPFAQKNQDDGKTTLCRFFSTLVNIIDNETAHKSINSLMLRLLDAHQIEFFLPIYYRLNWKQDRFEKLIFDVKIPELLSTGTLKKELREALEKVVKDFASRNGDAIEVEENTRKRGPTGDNCDIPQKLPTVDTEIITID